MSKVSEAIERLRAALEEYDASKDRHKEASDDLSERKKLVDAHARAVCDAENAPLSLFDKDVITVTSSRAEVDGKEAQVIHPVEVLGEAHSPDIPMSPTPVLNGTTGEIQGPPAPDGMTPSEHDPALCICGFELASPIADSAHGDRHARYLAAMGEPSAATNGKHPKVTGLAPRRKVPRGKAKA